MDERPRKPVIASRPEPPPDERDRDVPPRRAGLTKEEMQALLTVTATNSRPWGRVARRAGIGLIPTAVVGLALDTWVGWWATPVLAVLLAAWAAWPLLGQTRDGWT